MYTQLTLHTTPLEAHIVRGRLEAEGLTAIVLFEHHIWANWSLSNALGCVRLLVPADRRDDALRVLERINTGDYKSLLIEQQGLSQRACPSCGSTNTGVHAWLWKLALAFLFTISIPLPYTSHLYSCDDCRHSWIANDQRPYPLLAIAFNMALLTSGFAALFFVIRYFVAVERL